MDITEVRIKLMDDPHDRLQAFCSITLDGMFVIRDLKIIQGAKGPFVAMPSRKLTDRCPRCYSKNHLRSQFCNQCGVTLNEDRATKDSDGRAKLYADIAHPINSSCRETIQSVVLENFSKEKIRATQPDYVCTYDDFGEENFAKLADHEVAAEKPQEETVSEVTNSVTTEKTIRIDPPQSAIPQPHEVPADQKQFQVTAEQTEPPQEGFGTGIV